MNPIFLAVFLSSCSFLMTDSAFAQDEKNKDDVAKTERTKKLKAYAEACLKVSKNSPHKTKAMLSELEAESRRIKDSKELSKEEKKSSLESLEIEKRAVRSRKKLIYASLPYRREVGSIGTIVEPNDGACVFQILDEATTILRFPEATRTDGTKVYSYLMVKGVDTNGIVDGGQPKHLKDRPFEIAGTETYATSNGGSNTIYVAKPLSKEECQIIGEIAFPTKK